MKTLLCLTALFVSCSNLAFAQVDTSEVHVSVETFPQPEGGWPAFYQFLGKEIKYPKIDREAGTQGKVIVQFVVEINGTLSNIRLYPGTENGSTLEMQTEALRAIGESPKWKPGVQKGVKVRVQYQIPVKFQLSEISEEKERKH